LRRRREWVNYYRYAGQAILVGFNSGKYARYLDGLIGDRVFFIGEASSRVYPATVHGAFLTGEREAKLISKL
jgi:flavin-dependent amine oxidoreductase